MARGHDIMEDAKGAAEDRLQAAHDRSLPARKVVVERTLVGKPTDYQNLATVINLLMVDHPDTPARRTEIEIHLRRGGLVTTVHGTYRCAPAHTFPDWSPEMVKDTH